MAQAIDAVEQERLALAFGLSALLSIRVLTALGLPLGLRYDIALVVLYLLAVGFIVPKVGDSRLLAVLAPFKTEDSARAALIAAGGSDVREWAR